MAASIQSIHDVDFSPLGEVFPSPQDWRDHFMYFLLVDRFDNNQDPIPAYNPASTSRGRDPEEGGLFQGGNLKGIIRRLDY
ncbi:MAG: alpha-amylase, partial [Candidatus Aureabacteria bacterium]|nr:alpha-amylase [Candidatus Auribacterota bacterium]